MENNCQANQSIACTVQQCRYHCENQNYCSLEKIQVGTHEAHPKVVDCTDCQTFKVKESCC